MVAILKTVLMTTLAILMGCQTIPSSLYSAGQDENKQFHRKVVPASNTQPHDIDPNAVVESVKGATPIYLLQSLLMPGDLIRISTEQFPELNGLHQITDRSSLLLPGLQELVVRNVDHRQAKEQLEAHLRNAGWLEGEWTDIHLAVVEQAPISVSVKGAVFNPGYVVINQSPRDKPVTAIRQETGAHTYGRSLLEALQRAGGVRPDADISRVKVKRGGVVFVLDLTGVLDGDFQGAIPMLVAGDQVVISSLGVEQAHLIRPSVITPPGIRVFMSNLTAPALSNAQSAIGNDASRVPYGVSLMDVAISANCMGGTHMANASRGLVLVTSNHGSKNQLVIHRKINDLLANSSNVAVNPFVMPNDGIACYDSRFTNFRDVARGVGELINPFILGRLL